MLAPSRKRPLPLLAALVTTLLVFFYCRDSDRILVSWTSSLGKQHATIPANRTLGFGAVVAVSRQGSMRRHSLLQAANVTDFDITIPQQPQWTENDINRFRHGQVDAVQQGSLLAWLGHHNALQWFLDSGLETALILEDDVDWDVRLRTVQIPLAANAARALMPIKPSLNFLNSEAQTPSNYWGDHGTWDVMYLGHCGDYFNKVTYDGLMFNGNPFTLNDVAHLVYDDPTLPIPSELHPFTQDLFSALGMPKHARVLHRSKFPLCSFGYAVTRPAAQLLLGKLAPLELKPEGPRAFDVALLHACLQGANETDPISSRWGSPPSEFNRGLRCWTLNSELFHHMPGESEIASVGKKLGEEVGQGLPPVDLAGQTQALSRNETTNIECGFWSGAFAFHDADEKRLDFLRVEVAQKGKCLKHGRQRL